MIVPERSPEIGVELVVRGMVQGVGFRPFVYRLATAEQLSGRVRNTEDSLHIVLYGQTQETDRVPLG